MNIAHGSDQLESVCHDYDMLHHLFEDIIELRKSARCTASTSTGDCVLPNNSSGEEEDGDGEVEEVDMVMDAPDFDIDPPHTRPQFAYLLPRFAIPQLAHLRPPHA